MLDFMAIFGDLANMSTPEVFKMLGTRTGKLYLWPTPQKEFELHLHEGAVYCFREDGISVNDKATLQRSLSRLFDVDQGRFDFSQMTLALLSHELNVTRQEVWQLLAAAELTPETTDKQFSTDKATRFKLSNSRLSGLLSDLPENIQTFLQHAHARLATGCSAAELADALDMPVPLVQLYLMRLRSLDKITPVRAYAPGYKGYDAGYRPPVAPAPIKETKAPLLSPRAEVTPPVPLQPSAPQAVTQQPTARQVATQPVRPKQNFVRRLLSVLSFGGR